ncbi:MAG: efflux RND transporter periplasmic adaptor subunit [candidate division Zixibacteria bacterium]|nr:efflux RND transporter periplasmic adaptor subunit [candidate division Zixibacteria bacterium]
MSQLPQFRPDIIVSQQEIDGQTYYVLKDPYTRKFFRVKVPEYFIIQNLDGQSTPRQVSERFQTQFNLTLKPETVEKFVSQLESFGFLVSGLNREAERLSFQTKAPQSTFQKIIFLKLKAFDPNKFLDRHFPKVKFIFSKPFLLFSSAIVLTAGYITVSCWGEFSYSLTGLYKFSSVIAIWLTAFWVVSLHEFAHAFTCKYYGGEVREMGFLLLYLQPCFYCNLSDAWLFGEKRKRLNVGLSGAFFQIFIWGLATILWRLTDPATTINQFAFITMITSGILVLFNFNPLIKLDGYYLLSDYLEIPNLRKKAFHYSGNWFKRYVLRLPVEIPSASTKEKKVFPVYAGLALTYTVFLLGFVFWKLGEFLVGEFQGPGLVLYSAALLFIFKSPLQILAAGAGQFLLFQKEAMKSPKKLIVRLTILLLLLIILFVVKYDLRVSRECEIRAIASYTITNQPQSYLLEEKLFIEGEEERREVNFQRTISSEYGAVRIDPLVKEGQEVKSGDTIARLASNQYITGLESFQAQVQSAQANYELLKKGPRPEEILKAKNEVERIGLLLTNKEKEKTRIEKLWEQKMVSEEEWNKIKTDYEVLEADLAIAKNELQILKETPRPEELKKAAADLEKLKTQVNFYQQQVNSSQIKTPIAGLVTKVRPTDDLISIARYDTVLIMVPVSEKDMDVLRTGQELKTKVNSYPGRSFWGVVSKIAQQAEDNGGQNIFWITAKASNLDLALKPGMTGQAKIYCGRKPLISLLTRRLIRWLRVEVWSWF